MKMGDLTVGYGKLKNQYGGLDYEDYGIFIEIMLKSIFAIDRNSIILPSNTVINDITYDPNVAKICKFVHDMSINKISLVFPQFQIRIFL